MDSDPHGVSMRKPRRAGYEDWEEVYQIPEEIAECESPRQDHYDDDQRKIKENIDNSEIEAVVDCLACFFGCFLGGVQSKTSRDLHSKWNTLALLLILLMGIVAYTAHMNKNAADQLKRLNPLKARTTLMTAETKVKTPSKPTLKPEEHPTVGVISTHHRTGTVLFQNMAERLSSDLLIDYDRVAKPFQLSDFTATPAILSHRYWNATGRVVVGMHGFAENCEKGHNVGNYCPLMDYKCWLDACVAIDQKPEDKQAPIVHVVRNPVEFLVSSYLYHLQDPPPEDWLYKPKPDALGDLPMTLREKFATVPYFEVLKQLPPELGLLVDLTVGKEDLHRMARNYRDLEKKPYAMNLRFEDIKKDFKNTMKSALDHLKITHLYSAQKVMDIAMIFDLDNMPKAERNAYHTDDHITEGRHNKDDLRKLLYNNPAMRDMLEGLAGVMGYDNAFLSRKKGTESVRTEKLNLASTKAATR